MNEWRRWGKKYVGDLTFWKISDHDHVLHVGCYHKKIFFDLSLCTLCALWDYVKDKMNWFFVCLHCSTITTGKLTMMSLKATMVMRKRGPRRGEQKASTLSGWLTEGWWLLNTMLMESRDSYPRSLSVIPTLLHQQLLLPLKKFREFFRNSHQLYYNNLHALNLSSFYRTFFVLFFKWGEMNDKTL